MRTTFTPPCRLMQKVIKLVQSITLDLHSLCSISQLSNVNTRTRSSRKIHRTRQQTSIDQFLKNRIFDIERTDRSVVRYLRISHVLSTFHLSDLFLLFLFSFQIFYRRTKLSLNDESDILEFDRSIYPCFDQFRSHCKSAKKQRDRSFQFLKYNDILFETKFVEIKILEREKQIVFHHLFKLFKFIRR